jgi:hypothetical protein
VNEHRFWFVDASTAVHLTVVVPTGKTLPEGGSQTAGTLPLQLSAAVTEKNTRAPLTPPHSTSWFSGQVICGGSRSRIVTVKEHVLVFPAASVAVQNTWVTPVRNVAPLGGAQDTVTLGQLSVAVAV